MRRGRSLQKLQAFLFDCARAELRRLYSAQTFGRDGSSQSLPLSSLPPPSHVPHQQTARRQHRTHQHAFPKATLVCSYARHSRFAPVGVCAPGRCTRCLLSSALPPEVFFHSLSLLLPLSVLVRPTNHANAHILRPFGAEMAENGTENCSREVGRGEKLEAGSLGGNMTRGIRIRRQNRYPSMLQGCNRWVAAAGCTLPLLPASAASMRRRCCSAWLPQQRSIQWHSSMPLHVPKKERTMTKLHHRALSTAFALALLSLFVSTSFFLRCCSSPIVLSVFLFLSFPFLSFPFLVAASS